VAKPVVDGIERALEGAEARVIKLSVGSRIGQTLAGRYGVRGVPTLIVTGDTGEPVLRQVGRIGREAVMAAVAGITAN
jgi:thiol-disulfide isomerase/thioredoxin